MISCENGGSGRSSPDIENHPPELGKIDDKVVSEGERLVFTITAVDPDNDPMIFDAIHLPEGATFEAQEFSWQPAAGQTGVYTVTFIVTDDGIPPLSDSQTITIDVEPSRDPEPMEMEYGESGPYTIEEQTFINSLWPNALIPVSVLLPAERTGPVPVIFFGHGFSALTWSWYETLITHLVSRGFAVVYPPYPIFEQSFSFRDLFSNEDFFSEEGMAERYDILWNGFKEAAEVYEWAFDLQRVGFVGHSMGGGAIPAMAWRGLVEEGWGDQGAFLFIMAPWYSYEISDDQLAQFPGHLNLIMQVYDQDDNTDHRMAIDIFENISVPDLRKSYYNVPTGTHGVPSDREIDELDRFAVAEPLDALIDYTFEIERPALGKAFALDGKWDYLYHTVTKDPALVENESYYSSPWSSPWNPRFNETN